MPVFEVRVPADRFSPEQKRTLGQAQPEALREALSIPVEDQFVSITSPENVSSGRGRLQLAPAPDAPTG